MSKKKKKKKKKKIKKKKKKKKKIKWILNYNKNCSYVNFRKTKKTNCKIKETLKI